MQFRGKLVLDTSSEPLKEAPVAICFGGTHYPEKFTAELLHGKHALGTVMPKHALEFLDEELFRHIINQNKHKTIFFIGLYKLINYLLQDLLTGACL